VTDRGRTRWIDRALRFYGYAVYGFLFLPILVVVVFSFNSGRHVAELTGFSFQWYVTAWTDPFVVRAFRTSISIAFTAGLISTVLGTGAAIAMPSLPRWVRRSFDTMMNFAIVVPGIVLGLSLLIFVVSATGWLNDWIGYLLPDSGFRFGLGFYSVVAGHAVFGSAIVASLILGKTILGRYDFAIGSNEEATRLSGVNVDTWKMAIYTLCGLFAGLGGVLKASRLD